jgi:hypothetical protein
MNADMAKRRPQQSRRFTAAIPQKLIARGLFLKEKFQKAPGFISGLCSDSKGEKMTTETPLTQADNQKMVVNYRGGSGGGGVYGLGLIGAWVYYIGRATTNRERVVGFLKGLVWPAFMVYELFVFLEKK